MNHELSDVWQTVVVSSFEVEVAKGSGVDCRPCVKLMGVIALVPSFIFIVIFVDGILRALL